MKVKKGDTVLITAGKDKGRTAKILKAFPKEAMVLVEGMNMKSRHVRPRREGEKGQVVSVSSPMNVSNVMLICPKCGKATRIGYSIVPTSSKTSDTGKTNKKKFRVCKKCKSEI